MMCIVSVGTMSMWCVLYLWVPLYGEISVGTNISICGYQSSCLVPTPGAFHETQPVSREGRDSPFPISHYRDPCRGTPHFPMSRFHRGVEFFIFDVGVRADIFLFDVRDSPDFRGIFSEDRLRPRGKI
jgi:hypothetical protein